MPPPSYPLARTLGATTYTQTLAETSPQTTLERYDETWGKRRRAGKCSGGQWWRGLGLDFDESGI